MVARPSSGSKSTSTLQESPSQPKNRAENVVKLNDSAAWPEFIYRLVEHYKWEPQHLRGSMAEFDARIRRQEVPLNFLLNILFRLLPSEAIRTHSEMDVKFGSKSPYLFFLTKVPLATCWRPRGKLSADDNAIAFLRKITAAPLSESLSRKASPASRARYYEVKESIVYGTASWSTLGERLLQIAGDDDVAWGAILDFVSNLRLRKLVPPHRVGGNSAGPSGTAR